MYGCSRVPTTNLEDSFRSIHEWILFDTIPLLHPVRCVTAFNPCRRQRAEEFGADARSRGYSVAIQDLSDWEEEGWCPRGGGTCAFFVASWDGGRECSDVAPFFDWLRQGGDGAREFAQGVRFSICGLGSSSYADTYQAVARDLRSLLLGLGGTEAGPCGEEDERSPGEGFAEWSKRLWASLSHDESVGGVELVRVLWEGGVRAREVACRVAQEIRDDSGAGCTAAAGNSYKCVPRSTTFASYP